MSRRELVGRSLSDAGYTRIQADTYRYGTSVDLLKKLLRIDAAKRDRAEAHSGALATGLIPDTEANRVSCEPQFEFVTPQQLVAIDFFLSMHHYAPHAFPALAVWHDVNVLGRRYPIPTLESLLNGDRAARLVRSRSVRQGSACDRVALVRCRAVESVSAYRSAWAVCENNGR
jgi:hypothetical protein